MKRSNRGNAFFALLTCLCVLGIDELHAQADVELFNPNWSMVINSFGYSDFAFDQRPGFEGREYLSGEWAAAITYRRGTVVQAPTWLTPNFLFPDWTSNSDFGVESHAQQLPGTNLHGFAVMRSIITNAFLRIQITSEMVDTTNGIPQGLSPRSAPSGSNVLSDRYVLRQSFAITNRSSQTLSGIKFFQFLHALEAANAVYDDRNYGAPYNGHRYTITQQTADPFSGPGAVVHNDTVALHANVTPSAWQVGAYGVEGFDDHSLGKPSAGVHLAVEGDSLSGLDLFAPDTKWISGALRCEIGSLAPNASTNIQFIMSVRTVTVVEPPFFPIGKTSRVVAWGNNASGQTNVAAGLTNVTAIAAGGAHTLALRDDGTVVAWGNNSSGQTNVPAGLTGVQSIAAGGKHNLAVKPGGVIVAWGDNTSGQTNVPTGLNHVFAVAAGDKHNLAIKGDLTLAAWGDNTYGQRNIPASLSNMPVLSVAAGAKHSLARRLDGMVVAWGDNSLGQTNVPFEVAFGGASEIAAGTNHSLALLFDGTVVGWGDNSSGQTDIPPEIEAIGARAIAAGGNHSLALLYDGSVVAWGNNSFGQTRVPVTLSGPTAIAAGGTHSLGLASFIAGVPLAISRTGEAIVISWRAPASQSAETTMATLEEANTLHNSSWSDVMRQAVLEGGSYKVTVPNTPGNMFYRLNIFDQ